MGSVQSAFFLDFWIFFNLTRPLNLHYFKYIFKNQPQHSKCHFVYIYNFVSHKTWRHKHQYKINIKYSC